MSIPPLSILSSNRGEGLNKVEQIDKVTWEISPRADKSALIHINLRKSSSNAIRVSVVRSGRDDQKR
jgi:hypothetical protein